MQVLHAVFFRFISSNTNSPVSSVFTSTRKRNFRNYALRAYSEGVRRQTLNILWLSALLLVALTGAPCPAAAPQSPPKNGGVRTGQAIGTWWDRTAPAAGRKLPSSRHYTIRSDLAPELTKQYADHLDTMYDEYFRRLVQQAGLRKRSPEYPNVFMFATQQDYLDTLRTQFAINGTGSGGMFFIGPRGAGLAFWVEKLPKQRVDHVIQHEGFHQFANAFFGNELPPWLNEGLAEFFGESVVEGKSVIIGQASPEVVTQVRTAVDKEKSIPFLDLLQMDDKRWNGNVQSGNARLQYMQSWSMVHFLVYGANGKYEPYFSNMLKLLNAGTKPFDAWKKAFSIDTDAEVLEFEGKWKEYARVAKPGAYVAARSRLEFLAEGLREVWSKGIRPKDLEELKTAMRTEKFQYTSSSHGYVTKLDAADDANFMVPDDEVNTKQPSIEFVAAKPVKNTKTKKVEDEYPTPPAIRTRGLRPNDVGVRWIRSSTDPSQFDYEIMVSS